jgi:hypothetical protein
MTQTFSITLCQDYSKTSSDGGGLKYHATFAQQALITYPNSCTLDFFNGDTLHRMVASTQASVEEKCQ